jgi:hypothetical protein
MPTAGNVSSEIEVIWAVQLAGSLPIFPFLAHPIRR